MRLLILLAVCVLAACASTPPQHSSYLLRSDKGVESRQLSVDSGVYLGAITLASYVDQPGLVLVGDSGKLTEARYHQWAEPLRTSLRQFISQEISAQLGQDVLAFPPASKSGQGISIAIDQLHGNNVGDAVLVARWTVTDGQATTSYQFAQTQALSEDGYDALVSAQKALLEQLALAIAKTVKTTE